jgi:hypothetical protein
MHSHHWRCLLILRCPFALDTDFTLHIDNFCSCEDLLKREFRYLYLRWLRTWCLVLPDREFVELKKSTTYIFFQLKALTVIVGQEMELKTFSYMHTFTYTHTLHNVHSFRRIIDIKFYLQSFLSENLQTEFSCRINKWRVTRRCLQSSMSKCCSGNACAVEPGWVPAALLM